MNFEYHPSIATRRTARRFITVQVNCTQYVADCNHNNTVYSECTCNGEWIFRNISTRAATSSTVSHSCDVTPHRTVFIISTSNFSSSLTQQHCLLPQCYCCWWNWQNRTKCTVQEPFTVPTDGVKWTLCGVGATEWMVAVHNMVIQLVVCG